MKIPEALMDQFPATRQNQCPHLRNTCRSCGEPFDKAVDKVQVQVVCPHCNAKRERCGNACMTNEDSCRVHARGRSYSIYSMAMAQAHDVAFEEMLENQGQSFDQELAMARLFLADQLNKPKDQMPSGKEVLDMIETVVRIGERVKKIMDGETLNISFDDSAASEMRKYMRRYIEALKEALQIHLQDPVLIVRIMRSVQEKSRLKGNEVTLPKTKSQGKDFYVDTKAIEGKQDG